MSNAADAPASRCLQMPVHTLSESELLVNRVTEIMIMVMIIAMMDDNDNEQGDYERDDNDEMYHY